MKCQSEKNYDGAEIYIKEALKMLKQQNQDKSLGYLYLLNKLHQHHCLFFLVLICLVCLSETVYHQRPDSIFPLYRIFLRSMAELHLADDKQE